MAGAVPCRAFRPHAEVVRRERFDAVIAPVDAVTDLPSVIAEAQRLCRHAGGAALGIRVSDYEVQPYLLCFPAQNALPWSLRAVDAAAHISAAAGAGVRRAARAHGR